MSDGFYRAFEERYRGPRELIKSRLKAYQPFIEPLLAQHESAKAIDLGCGRGEWLELASELGFDAVGVDLDDGMLAACLERKLNAQKADALQTLRELPEKSVVLVSAFHVVEHMAFSDVRVLIHEALRVLKPGGLLILETPNPENLTVGASSFYTDPSHERPIPLELLSFAVEHAGFHRNKILRLQETADLHTNARIGLLSVLNGVSPDYGVIAQKSAEFEVMSRFDKPFHANYGISLEMLTQRYDQQAEARVQQAEARVQQAEEQILTIYTSRSWRLTAPLRGAEKLVSLIKQKLHQLVSNE